MGIEQGSIAGGSDGFPRWFNAGAAGERQFAATGESGFRARVSGFRKAGMPRSTSACPSDFGHRPCFGFRIWDLPLLFLLQPEERRWPGFGDANGVVLDTGDRFPRPTGDP